LSKEVRARLVVVNLWLWAMCGIIALVALSGPRGAIESHLEPIGRELGGWSGLLAAAAGFDSDPIPAYEISIAPDVIGAARLLSGDPTLASASDSRWFPARLRTQGEVFPIWLQLLASSALPDLNEQAWRIRFETGHGPHAMGEISLFPTSTETHARETAIRETASALGLLAPPHGFASLQINGVETGTYFWSQGDRAAMLAQLGYPDGGVLLPNRNRVQLASARSGSAISAYPLGHTLAPTVRASHTGPAAAPAERQLERLFDLVDHASNEVFEREVPQLLDIGKYLRWNALAWMLGDPDIDPYTELGWYLDPVGGLLEPIVEDWPRGDRIAADRLRDDSRLTARLLRTASHRAERNQLLWDWVTKSGNGMVENAERRLGQSLTRLARADATLSHVWRLYDQADYRREQREALHTRKALISEALRHAEVRIRTVPGKKASTTTLAIELEPRGLAEIELSELRVELRSAVTETDAVRIRLFDPSGSERRSTRVVPEIAGSAVRLRLERFSVAEQSDGDPRRASEPWRLELALPFLDAQQPARIDELLLLELAFRNTVTGEALPPARLLAPRAPAEWAQSDRYSGDALDVARPVQDVIRESGLRLRIESDALVLPAGSHLLTRTLVVPPDFRLEIAAGVTLRMSPGASIVSFRGVTARGTQLDPIAIRAADPNHAWGVIGIVRAPEPSALEFVTISGGSKLDFAGVEFDGQISFNASDFVISESEISGSRAGDGLSAKRASFAIRNTRFANNANDGVESEWSEGTVTGSAFVANGDDGIDLADSRLRVSESDFGGMIDKAISADARSIVTVSQTRLENSEIAIASKNGSRVDVRESLFRSNRLGFAVYRDKPLFDGGHGAVVEGLFEDNERDFSIEPGSELELIRINQPEHGPYRTGSDSFVLAPASTRFSRTQSSILYSSTPSNGEKRY
jgi:hypothetical protein